MIFQPFEVTNTMPGKDAPLIQLSAQSQAKDAGVSVSNLAEEFDGAVPDLGAFEIGTRIPHYGPRDDPGMIPLDWVLKHQR